MKPIMPKTPLKTEAELTRLLIENRKMFNELVYLKSRLREESKSQKCITVECEALLIERAVIEENLALFSDDGA